MRLQTMVSHERDGNLLLFIYLLFYGNVETDINNWD